MGTESAQTLLGTPQVTRGRVGRSPLPIVSWSSLDHTPSMGCFSISSVIIVSDQMSNVKRKTISRTESNHPRVSEPAMQDSFSCCPSVVEKTTRSAPSHREGIERDSQFLSHSSITIVTHLNHNVKEKINLSQSLGELLPRLLIVHHANLHQPHRILPHQC